MAVHAEPTFVWALMPLALLGGIFVLCVLFFCKRTRPLAWTLLGLGGVGLMFMIGYAWLSLRHERIAPTAHDWPHSVHEVSPVDIEALLGPRIQLDGQTVIVGQSAHPAHAAPPLEVRETVEAAPPEAQHLESSHAHSEDDSAAAPSASSSAAEQPGASAPPGSAPQSAASEASPDWVENPPARDPQKYPVVLTTDPFANKTDADRQASELMMIAADEVVSDLVGEYRSQGRGTQEGRYLAALERLRGMGLTPGYLRSSILREEHVEHLKDLDMPANLTLPFGHMVRVHMLLEFDQPFQTELQSRWREHQAHQRLGVLGMIAAGVVGLLAVVWGTLTFDTATKGYYTKWLVAGAVLGTMAVGFLVLAAVA